ncbi:Aspartate ammonia-lyase [hydrothermal vent metagenome]|uniref:Aspartate ammonia-lyase n=1 Tax=hydrothermal vent metagenome TaxID=652676 RepID=A0A3B0YY65_9ZZZZ
MKSTLIGSSLLLVSTLIPLHSGHIFAATAKANVLTVKSKPTAVTIYLDRAQVTRSMSRELTAGKYTLVFDNLPYAINQNSVQINGTQGITLVDVKFKKKQFTVIPDVKIATLNNEKLKLIDAITDINDTIANANSEKSLINKISLLLTTAGNKAPPVQLDPDKWVKMVTFYRGKLTSLSKEIRHAEREQRQFTLKLDQVTRQLKQFGAHQYKTKNQVHATIIVNKPGRINLNLSYMVRGPSWKPIYDLRVLRNKKQMNLTYNALIKQNTGEDWNNINVSLSTAQVHVSGQQKALSPWRISLYTKMLKGQRSETRYERRPYRSKPSVKNEANPKQMFNSFASKKLVNRRPRPSKVNVKTKATSVVFTIKQKYTLASDNSPHKVSIMSQDFDTKFRYSTVPKLAPYAYLKANVVNSSQFPLLAGKTNVFLDNNFVAHSYMKSVAPGEVFWTFLGVDEAIKVEYKFIKRHEKTEGIFSKSKVFTYEYLIKIKNKKKSKIKLVVWDQLPISSNDELKVTLVEPQINSSNKKVAMNKQKFIEWFFTPDAGQELTIPLKFNISYPAGQKKMIHDPVWKAIF